MTYEEKELLDNDICARLPYGVKVSFGKSTKIETLESFDKYTGAFNHTCAIPQPYLYPMSIMTEEEIKIERELQQDCLFGRKPLIELTNFYYSRHLDVNGLIEKGLAKEACEGMYITK